MVKAYPQFRSSYSHEEMVEHFLLTPAELQLVFTCRGDRKASQFIQRPWSFSI